MSLIIKGMEMPKHVAVNGEKDTAYKCVILAHPDNSVELVIDTKFASAYDNGHNVKRYPLVEVPTPHGRLIDADGVLTDLKSMASTNESVPTTAVLELIDHQPVVLKAEVSE